MLNPRRTLTLSFAVLLFSGIACSSTTPNAAPSNSAPDPASPAASPTAAPSPTIPQAPQTAANPEPSTTPLTASTKITTTGLGPVQVGMTIAAAEAATGQTFTQRSSGGEEYGCLYYTIEGFEDVSVMVTDGTIARVEVLAAGMTTLSGAQVGDSAERIRNLYPGQIESEPHEYVPSGEYLIFVPQEDASQDYRVIFETDDTGTVTMIRAGRLPEVGYIEGCV
ncbi:hypothetical protein PN441_03905 [Spirulina major CS-329]|uniref:hypothetical protein n=2 Tax=Spirulinaceae TaxID=1890448 RepID=UPI00232ED732|nr:hypothetical protein [Spirulina major]MDB9502203.1 hypothetical protein [Spirulina major CS-329]